MTDAPRTIHRFDPQQIGQLGSGVEMVADPDGEWVRASDHDDVVRELVEALEEISEIDDVCRRNCAFRKSLGWYEDETIRVRDQHNAMAWADAAKIARAALAKLKEADSDMRLNAICDSRNDGPTIPVDLDDL